MHTGVSLSAIVLNVISTISFLYVIIAVAVNYSHRIRMFIKSIQKSDVTCGQMWWPMLGIVCSAFNPSEVHTHTAVNTHTHTPWTHTRSSGQPIMLWRPGAVGGSVPCSRAPQSGYWRWRERSLPPTIPAGSRLEPATFQLRVQLSNN